MPGQTIPNWTSGQQYFLKARYVDAAGNQSADAASSFFFDLALPSATIQKPSLPYENTLSVLSGTAQDTSQTNTAGTTTIFSVAAQGMLLNYQWQKNSTNLLGALFGIMDRLDLLAGALGTGIEPTGSQDPFALRRAGGVVVKLIRAYLPKICNSGLT